jgi:tRNA pseudouridine55 synthase
MARRRKGRPVDGIVLVDKPAGLTSNAVLQRVKHAFFAQKAGHTGALDPLATGVLPLCLGEATKFSQYLLDADKTYLSTFVLGESRNTSDADGEITATVDASHITQQQVEAALEAFTGEIQQTPSMFSALKHQGQPLYKLARRGEEVERKARTVTIFELSLEGFVPGSLAEVMIRVHCSKGTYVRSIAEDLGAVLNVGAHVSELRRINSGPFGIDECISLDRVLELGEAQDFDQLDSLLRAVVYAIQTMPMVSLDNDSSFYLCQGQPVVAANLPSEGLVRVAKESGEFLGVAEVLEDGRITPRRLVVSQEARTT